MLIPRQTTPALSVSPLKQGKPALFTEPAVYIVRPDSTLYYGAEKL